MRPVAVILFARAEVRLIYLCCVYSIGCRPMCHLLSIIQICILAIERLLQLEYDEAVDVS